MPRIREEFGEGREYNQDTLYVKNFKFIDRIKKKRKKKGVI